jgi:hypothetical protein
MSPVLGSLTTRSARGSSLGAPGDSTASSVSTAPSTVYGAAIDSAPPTCRTIDRHATISVNAPPRLVRVAPEQRRFRHDDSRDCGAPRHTRGCPGAGDRDRGG